MATILSDYAARAQGGDRGLSAERRNAAWRRWEEFEQACCPSMESVETSLAWLSNKLSPLGPRVLPG
jgi:hypothetical protein